MIPANKHHFWLAIWGILQIALLGIGASGFPLWSHHPFPRESLALPVVLCGQTLLIAMLCPILFFDVSIGAISLILMLPIDELAGLLSNCSQTVILSRFGCVSLWLLGLLGWAWLLKNSASRLIVVAMATLFTTGGAILDYLRWEAAASGMSGKAFQPISLLPILCDLSLINSSQMWVLSALPLFSFLATIIFLRIYQKQFNAISTLLHDYF